MPSITHDGGTLYYLTRGNGAAVLLIHGLGSTGADWAFQVPALEHRFRLIVPDLPGCGHSQPAPQRYDIAAVARALWALLDALSVPVADIVGYSLGGAVALEMSLQRPHAVPRLVLINSLASYRLDHWTKWVEAHLTTTLVRLIGMRRAGRLVALRLFPGPAQAAMRERCAAVIGAVPREVYLGMARGLQGWSATDRLDTIRSRTLVIAAEHDYTPLNEKHELATALGGALVVVRGSRHGTPFDAVRVTNTCLAAHLEGTALPLEALRTLDAPEDVVQSAPAGSLVDEHAAAR